MKNRPVLPGFRLFAYVLSVFLLCGVACHGVLSALSIVLFLLFWAMPFPCDNLYRAIIASFLENLSFFIEIHRFDW